MSDTRIVTVPAGEVRPGDWTMAGRRVTHVVPCGKRPTGGLSSAVDIMWDEPVILPARFAWGEWEPRVEADYAHTHGMVRRRDVPVTVVRS